MISRTLLVVPAVLLALTASACGSEPEAAPLPSAADARTAACRGYVLTVGDRDASAITTLRDGAGFADPDATAEALAPLRAAAVDAALAPGLSEADFALFRAVADEVDDLQAAVDIDQEGVGTLAPSTIDALDAAARAVRTRCA